LTCRPDPTSILGIDGATATGYALWCGGEWFTETEWTDQLAEAVRELQPIVVGEAQYPSASTGRDSLITLCARAWYRYGRATAVAGTGDILCATAAMWRGQIDNGWAGLDKLVVLNRLWQRHSADLPDRDVLTLDEQDACGIAFSFLSAWRAGNEHVTFCRWPDLPKSKPRGRKRGPPRRRK
jgi:hypothetical protein